MMCVTEWLRMVAAHGGIHLCFNGIAHLQAAGFQHAVVAEYIGLDLERVFHGKAVAARGNHALVADLAAGFCIKRSGVQNNHAVLTSLQLGNRYTVSVKRYDFADSASLS